jgi:hypothetical protein
MRIAAASLALFLLAPLPVLAQDTVYEEQTNYDFEDDYVDGQVIRPDGELIDGRRAGKESSLINIRSSFIDEMVQSVEDL